MDADASGASIGYTVANAQCQIVGNLAPIIVVAAADADANSATTCYGRSYTTYLRYTFFVKFQHS